MNNSDPPIPRSPKPITPTCPACGQRVPVSEHKRLWQLYGPHHDLATQQADLDRQRLALRGERQQIAAHAIAAERGRWEQLRERDMQHHERAMARRVTALEAKAGADVERRVREARRAVAEEQRALVTELRAQVRTIEQRRQRDEATLQQTIVELRRKAEGRDQGHFGEDGEQDLIRALRERFPSDVIDHRGKGGDVLQKVSQNLPQPVRLPDLKPWGLTFRGARLVVVDSRPAAQLVYTTDNKAIGPLALIIGSTKQPDIAPTFERRQDLNLLYWRHQGRASVLVGQSEIGYLWGIANDVAWQLDAI